MLSNVQVIAILGAVAGLSAARPQAAGTPAASSGYSPPAATSSALESQPMSTPASSSSNSGGASSAQSYNCGCSSRKQQLESQGASAFDMAVAFQETGSKLSGTAYAYGDGKTQDSANFGLFKNNWYMIRTYCSQFKGQAQADWNNGAVLNSDDAAAITCQNEQVAALGQQKWFSGQRYAQSGLAGQADQSSIQQYAQGVQSIESYLNGGHMTDDMATYANVQAV